MIRHRSLLALTADATRTGATLLLGSLLEELGRDGAVDPARTRVVAGRGGAREPDLAAIAPVRVAAPAAAVAGEAAARLHPAARTVGERLGLAWGLIRTPRRDPGPPDLVWAQGAAALRLAEALPRPARRAPLVAYVHDAGVGLTRRPGGVDLAAALARPAVVVATSDAVADHLVAELGVERARVVVALPWVADLGPMGPTPVTGRRPEGVPEDALVVVGCGSVGWRRGTDLFFDLASRLALQIADRPVHLVWVGGSDRTGDDERMATEVEARGLEGRVHLVGEATSLAPWIAGSDLVVSTGRSPGLPTAALEAGSRGRAVVGWRTSGIGPILPDGVRRECLVEPFDLPGLAGRVEALLADDGARASVATELRAHVLTHHQAAPSVRDLWSDVAAHLARAT